MQGILKDIAKILSCLPNIGPRSAAKITIALANESLKKNELNLSEKLISSLKKMCNEIKPCKICNNLSEKFECFICEDKTRDSNQICIISDIPTLWAIEKIGQFEGLYHVLGYELSLSNIEDMEKSLLQLEKRILQNPDSVKEIIIAMNPTISGQATSSYLQDHLKNYENIVITTLSLGIPMGSQIDYLDSGTIAMAMASRREI